MYVRPSRSKNSEAISKRAKHAASFEIRYIIQKKCSNHLGPKYSVYNYWNLAWEQVALTLRQKCIPAIFYIFTQHAFDFLSVQSLIKRKENSGNKYFSILLNYYELDDGVSL